MKVSLCLFSLSLALTTVATPLGDRAIFRRHNGAPLVNARRYILQSRMEPPPACVNKASNTVNATGITDPSSTAAVPTPTDGSTSDGAAGDTSANTIDDGSSLNNSTVSDANNSTISNTGNSTVSDGSNNSTVSNTDNNSTISNSDNSTDATNSTARRRHLTARLAQLDLPDLAMEWQKLCLASGGDVSTSDSPCVKLAGLGGIDALLAEADPCAQQDIADAMITFAKSPGIVNQNDLIAYAIKYRQHPRNAVNILGVVPATLYCQKPPVNSELVGIVNDQLDGVAPGLYGSPTFPIVPFGANGTCPFGTTPDISTCSCVDINSANGTDVSATDDTIGADNSTATLDPTATGSADNSTVSAESADATATNTADNSTVTDVNPSDSATVDASTETVTDAATATSSANDAGVTDLSNTASATEAVDTLSATDASNTANATPADTAAPPAATTARTPGPNFQPSDISGDVNDPNGRR